MTALRRVCRAAATFWLATTLVFVAANLAALAWLSWRGWRPAGPDTPAGTIDTAALAQAYPDLGPAELRELARESSREFIYEPFTQFREKPGAGRWVNVDPNGFRRTKDQGPWPPDARYFTVFLFGGSTTFSYGVADDETVASALQDALRSLGLAREPRVYNFGRGAYYSSQERALFEKLVVEGHAPDAAVFLDGLNDFMFHDDRPAMTPLLERMVERWKEQVASPWETALRALPLARAAAAVAGAGPVVPIATPGPPPPEQATVSERVIARYLETRRIVEAVAAAHGIRAIFVWQPVPMYEYDLAYHPAWKNFQGHQYAERGYAAMAAQLAAHPPGPDFVWCADIQAGEREELYVDQVHYAPRMTRKIAACIAAAAGARGLLR